MCLWKNYAFGSLISKRDVAAPVADRLAFRFPTISTARGVIGQECPSARSQRARTAKRRYHHEAHYSSGAGNSLLLFAAGRAFAHHPFEAKFEARAAVTLFGAVTQVSGTSRFVYVVSMSRTRAVRHETGTWNPPIRPY
jgi:hypothetical protein